MVNKMEHNTTDTNYCLQENWINICNEQDLVTGSGVCALLQDKHNAEQVALFRVSSDGPVFALGNWDPLGKANVLSRGIIGSLGDKLVVASPLYKQHFCLHTGQCVEDENVKVKAWAVRISAGQVYLLNR